MKSTITVLTIILLSVSFVSDSYSQTVNRLVGASPYQDSLWIMDTTGFTVTRRLAPTSSLGGSVTGILGLAKHPVSGTVYVIAKETTITGRLLGKLNLTTGLITAIGDLGDNFSSITFRGDSLLGTTGDGALVPETLYMIDTNTAIPTFLTALGNGDDGEVICYNPTDDMIYHWSGNITVIFEKFSPVAPYTVTSLSTFADETFGAVWVGTKFLQSNINMGFNYVSTSGTFSTEFGSSPDNLRGLFFISCDRSITGTNGFCPNDSTLLTGPDNAISYQWYKDGNPIAGETSQTLYVSTVGGYHCVITDDCGLGASTVINVTQFSQPTVTLSSSGTVICSGDSLLLTGSSGGTSQWYMNGVAIPGATSNTYYASSAGVYNMIKTNTNGCSDSASVGLTITVDSCLSVHELNKELFSVYPNPAKDFITVQISQGNGFIVIMDVEGRKVAETKITMGSNPIDISRLPAGVYVLNATVDGSKASKRIVISDR